MKVLFTLTKSINPTDGGVQNTTFKLGKFFTENGLDVYYFSTKQQNHVSSKYGRLFHALEPGGAKNRNNIVQLKEKIHEIKPDIVINQMPYEEALRNVLFEEKSILKYKLLACLRNSLFSFKNNAIDITKGFVPALLHRLVETKISENLIQKRHSIKHGNDLRKILDQNDYFILLAPPNKTELNYFIGDYCSEKVVCIPNSIPSVCNTLPGKKRILLFVGRLNIQQKRADLLLPLWKIVLNHLPNWEFKIVGSGDLLSKLQDEIKKERIPRVSCEGYQKPAEYYKEAPLFVMPSAYEGFPNVILEAQSYGCVPIAFDSYSALGWIVNDQEDSVLVPPFDLNVMASEIKKMALDDGKRITAAEKALQNARNFTIDRVGMQWLTFFDQILERS